MADLMLRYPRIEDLEPVAIRRIPYPLASYLLTGTNSEIGLRTNRAAFDSVRLVPRRFVGELDPDISCELFGTSYAAPFGVAPVGGSMLIWPGSERYLASMAVRRHIPYCMPFLTSATLEAVSEITKGMGWYQLYAPNDIAICDDIVHRADVSKYEVLVFTVDVPRPGRRDRFYKAKGEIKRFNLLAWWRTGFRPAWMYAALLNRSARIEIIQRYSSKTKKVEIGDFVGKESDGGLIKLSWEYLARLRDQWKRRLVVKGIMHPEDARRCLELGVDAVWISNHGARQLDAFPSTLAVLPEIRREVGKDYPLILDSGVRSGTDVVRAFALGADFVMLGRPFMFGVGALGRKGADHVADIIETQIVDTMVQVGINRLSDLTGDICHLQPDCKNYFGNS